MIDIPISQAVDFAQRLKEFTGKADGVELTDKQLESLSAGGMRMVRHERPDETILVMMDDWLRRLVVVVRPDSNFAFFTDV